MAIKNDLFNGPGLILMVGLPMSGKSTLAEKCASYSTKVVVVSTDTIRMVVHGKPFVANREAEVWFLAQTMVKVLLCDGYVVIVDACNTTKQTRKTWVNIAKAARVQVKIIAFGNMANICRLRNNSIHRIDNAVIDRMEKNFVLPTVAEGVIMTANEVERLINDEDSTN